MVSLSGVMSLHHGKKEVRSRFITPSGLEALVHHKYCGVEYSWLYNYVISPLCNRIVTFFPRTLAPNTITTMATFSQFMAFLLLVLFSPNLDVAPCLHTILDG